MPREYPGYHDLDERLVEFRTEILTRMCRDPELASLPRFDRVNLAAEPGSVVTVDSFRGTVNTDQVSDVYFRVLDATSGKLELGALGFVVEDPLNPTLQALRERFPLVDIAGEGTDVERAVRIRDWIKSLFPHYIPYRMPVWNALTILDRASRGVENFICIHYSVSLVQCCLALGMQARMINIHRGIANNYVVGDESIADPPVDEHVVAEVWSSELGSWVLLDTDFDCHYERAGVPLSAWEIHQAFVAGDLDQLTCRRGPDSHAFTALGGAIESEDHFFGYVLPSYYAHVSVLMRNDFLGDPDGPVQVAHLTDVSTEAVIWHRGSDLRLQPHLMGPVVVANPYSDEITLLTDGNNRTGWASEDSATEHWVQVSLPGDRVIDRIAFEWPEYAGLYRSSRTLRAEAEVDGGWTQLAEIRIDPEGPFTMHELPVTRTRRVRIVQPVSGGHALHPDRLWLTQVELFGPPADDL